jgi:hypothetical protein
MKIRYYCPECRKKSILNAIFTAEPRVCAWCGYPINPKHVKEQSENPRLSWELGVTLSSLCGWAWMGAMNFPDFLGNNLSRFISIICPIIAIYLIVVTFLRNKDWESMLCNQRKESGITDAADQK